MKARISNLHKTEAEWLKLQNWKPEAGELIIYDPDENYKYSRLKVGDGIRTLNELEFFVDQAALKMLQKQQYFEILDGGRIIDYKK